MEHRFHSTFRAFSTGLVEFVSFVLLCGSVIAWCTILGA